jgi:hypothetical protein
MPVSCAPVYWAIAVAPANRLPVNNIVSNNHPSCPDTLILQTFGPILPTLWHPPTRPFLLRSQWATAYLR